MCENTCIWGTNKNKIYVDLHLEIRTEGLWLRKKTNNVRPCWMGSLHSFAPDSTLNTKRVLLKTKLYTSTFATVNLSRVTHVITREWTWPGQFSGQGMPNSLTFLRSGSFKGSWNAWRLFQQSFKGRTCGMSVLMKMCQENLFMNVCQEKWNADYSDAQQYTIASWFLWVCPVKIDKLCLKP